MAGGLLGQGAGVVPTGFNGEDKEEEPNVSPEEQKQYDTVVKNALEFLYTRDGKVLPEVLGRLNTDKPIDGLAQTCVWVVMMVENSAKANNFSIDDDVLFHASTEIIEELAEIASKAKIHDFTQGEIQGAWYNALDMYREANTGDGGRFNPEQAASEFQALNQADMEGRADDVLPGFSMVEQAQSMAGKPEDEEGDEDKITLHNKRGA